MLFNLEKLFSHASENTVQINGKWVPVRPLHGTGFFNFKNRLIATWKVLTGKADAVVWPEGQ